MARALALAAIASVLAAGCHRPLFPADAPRTPYERHRELRRGGSTDQGGGGRAGPRGGRRGGGTLDDDPNLRERLQPLE